MEATPTPTDLTSEELEYVDVDDGGAMMVEDLEDERENMPPPPPPMICTATPHPAPVLRELIPIENPAPVPMVEVVNAEGEDDAWYIPPVMHHQIHALDEFTTAAIEPVLEYVEDHREDPLAGPHHDDLPMDGSEDELWANLGVNLRDRHAE
jgi:hypothetical protein